MARAGAIGYENGSYTCIDCGFASADLQATFTHSCTPDGGIHFNAVTSKPAHYTQGHVECIQAIHSALTPEEFQGYCKGNIIKYAWRERHKGSKADLQKAADYLGWAINPDSVALLGKGDK